MLVHAGVAVEMAAVLNLHEDLLELEVLEADRALLASLRMQSEPRDLLDLEVTKERLLFPELGGCLDLFNEASADLNILRGTQGSL